MTGNEKGKGVFIAGVANGASRFGLSKQGSESAVADGLPKGNLLQSQKRAIGKGLSEKKRPRAAFSLAIGEKPVAQSGRGSRVGKLVAEDKARRKKNAIHTGKVNGDRRTGFSGFRDRAFRWQFDLALQGS